jgi:hypothetical protein
VNVDNLSIFYVFCCLHKIRFFTDINKYYYIIYVLLSCDSSIEQVTSKYISNQIGKTIYKYNCSKQLLKVAE